MKSMRAKGLNAAEQVLQRSGAYGSVGGSGSGRCMRRYNGGKGSDCSKCQTERSEMTKIRRRKRRKYEYGTIGSEAVGKPLQLQLGRKASRRSKSHEKIPSPQFVCCTETGLNLPCKLILSKIVSFPVVVVLLRERWKMGFWVVS
ncbi:hypothetical protein ACFX13_035143 [Malus domestica]